MSDIALLMTGVLTTGQPSPQILPAQPLVQLCNGVEKSTRGELSQLVPTATAQITPPEFMQPNGTLLAARSAFTERNTGVAGDVEDTGGNILDKICSQVDAKKLHQISTHLPLAGLRENTATEIFRTQQRSATNIADKPQIIDEQDSDNKMVVTKSQQLTSPLPILEFGDSGTSVRVLQRLLSFHGYVVEVDGVFGGLTEIAVSSFQYRRNLVIDGIVGQRTWDELAK